MIRMGVRFFVITVILFLIYIPNIQSQDISLLYSKGQLPGTYLNPGIALNKTWNISLAGFYLNFGTDGPSINDITSKNSLGHRFIDINKLKANTDDYQNIYYKNDIHTIDLSFKAGGLVIMAGHAFRSSGNLKYPKGLIEVAAQGNAAFIGQTIEIAPLLDINAYNEMYLGLQKSFGPLTVGVKGKLLFGTANVKTEKAKIGFTTKDEFYQLNFDTDYLVRSSSLFRYNNLDSITFKYNGFSFDNLFYNNRGYSFDIGASFMVNDKLTLSASVLDIGKINWDFFPRKYTSKGNFSFEGVDIINYLHDSISVGISDTLLHLLEVKQTIENYKTALNSTLSLGATFSPISSWTFNGLLLVQNNFSTSRTSFSLGVLHSFSIFDAGIHYSVSRNNYSGLGLYTKIRLGPVSAFASTDNIIGTFRPFDSRSASIRLGATLQL